MIIIYLLFLKSDEIACKQKNTTKNQPFFAFDY